MSVLPEAPEILLGRAFASKQELIQAIGDIMVTRGEVTPGYVEGMLRKEETSSTWVMDGVAMPHGTNDVKSAVLRNSVVLVQLREGIDWGGGRKVHLVIGVAGRGDDQHVRLLGAIARVLQDGRLVARLKTTNDEGEVRRILAGREA